MTKFMRQYSNKIDPVGSCRDAHRITRNPSPRPAGSARTRTYRDSERSASCLPRVHIGTKQRNPIVSAIQIRATDDSVSGGATHLCVVDTAIDELNSGCGLIPLFHRLHDCANQLILTQSANTAVFVMDEILKRPLIDVDIDALIRRAGTAGGRAISGIGRRWGQAAKND
ncbi:MAG: hypothetical protein R3E66_21420 [bacterium]